MKTAVIVLLCIIAFLIFLLVWPVSFYVKYENEDFFVTLRYFFFKKKLFPSEKKEKQTKTEQKTEKKEPGPKKKEPFLSAVNRGINLLTSVAALSKEVVSMHRVKYSVKVRVGSPDAAETAINVGKYNAALYSAAAVLSNLAVVKKSKISVMPDYDKKQTEIDFFARFYSYPIHYLFNLHKLLPLLLKAADALPDKKQEKGEKK